MIKKIISVVTLFSLIVASLPVGTVSAANTNILITEIQVGINNEKNEFVEIYNPTDSALTFQNLRIEYLSSSFTGSLSTQTRVLGTFHGTMLPHTTLLLRNDLYVTPPLEVLNADIVFGSATSNPTTGFLANSGGYVRLVQENGPGSPQLVDCIRWGGSEASTLAGCQRVAAAHASDQTSLQRPFINGVYQTANGIIDSPITPRAILNTVDSPTPDPDPTTQPTCQGVSISEIVPNPDGDDTGYEFVELFNATESDVDLTGCSLRIGTAVQGLGGTINPGYTAIYGYTLPNSAGGQVAFVTPTGEAAVDYPASLGDDESYSLIDGAWQRGALSTPNAANALPAVVAGTVATTTDDALESCGPGKYRNPDTNRCRNIEAGSILTPCNPGQVRNPDTNRCRNAAVAASVLAPCDPGETRNPDTNRCRKNATTTALALCQEGQQRNPETNRCRKVAGANSANPISNPAKANSKPVSYYVLGIVAALALAYGIYEYRDNIYRLLLKSKRKVFGA